jgi:hypothetical protein
LELLQGVVVETDRVRRRQAKSLTAEEVIDKAEKVAVEMKTGNLGRASKILVAAGRPPQDAAAKEVMIEKHPQAGLEAQIELRTKGTAALAGPPAGAARQVAIEINTRELQEMLGKQAKAMDATSAGGADGLQPNHIKLMLRVRAGRRKLLPAMARLCVAEFNEPESLPALWFRLQGMGNLSAVGEAKMRNLVLDKLAEAGCSAVEGRPARSWSIERGGVGELRRVVGSRDGVLDSSDRP